MSASPSLCFAILLLLKIFFLMEKGDPLLCHGVPGSVLGCPGSTAATPQHLSLVQSAGIWQSNIKVLQTAVLVLIPEQWTTCSAFFTAGACPWAAPSFVTASPWWQPAGQVDTRAPIERQGQSWPCRVLRQAEQPLQQAVRGKMALAVLLAALLGLVVIVKWFLFQPRNRSCPPCIGSWIPWVGAAFQFGKAPLEFIEQARSKVRAVAACLPLGVCAS